MKTSSVVIDSNLKELITAISVDDNAEIYPIEKLDAHVRDIHHSAISVFVFSGSQLLMQRRADTKYHSGGLWANTVCSHPRWQESADRCASRRLREELGLSIPMRKFGEISYHTRVGDLYENEHVHCFFGRLDNRYEVESFNRLEVSEVQWLSIPTIMRQIAKSPESFTEWFKIYMTEYRDMILKVV